MIWATHDFQIYPILIANKQAPGNPQECESKGTEIPYVLMEAGSETAGQLGWVCQGGMQGMLVGCRTPYAGPAWGDLVSFDGTSASVSPVLRMPASWAWLESVFFWSFDVGFKPFTVD